MAMAKVAAVLAVVALFAAGGVRASVADSDSAAVAVMEAGALGPNLDVACGAEDRLDFVMCLKMSAWVRSVKGVFAEVTDMKSMCSKIPTNPESRARCEGIMGVHKTQLNCAVNAPLKTMLKYLETRVDEHWCWSQLLAVRKADGKAVPNESCRAETISGKPRCLFFHGVGEAGPDFGVNRRGRAFRSNHPGFLLKGLSTGNQKMATYWGQSERMVTDECEAWFFHTETSISGWDRRYLQDEYCGAIEVLNPAVIFTHSMANLVVSAGITNRVAGCYEHIARGGLGTRWFGIQGPLQGATPTGLGVLNCKSLVKVSFLKKLIDGRCDEETGQLPPSYASMVLGYTSKEPGRAQLQCKKDESGKAWDPEKCLPLAYTATLWMSGSLCGLKPTTTVDRKTKGLFKKKIIGWALTLLSKMTHAIRPQDPDWDPEKMTFPTTGNDGMVGFASCRLYDATGKRMDYVGRPSAPYYGANVNHADGTCREGDVPSDEKQQACAWLLEQVKWVNSQRRLFVNGPEENPSSLAAHVRRQVQRIKGSATPLPSIPPVQPAATATPATQPAATPSRTAVPAVADALANALTTDLNDRAVAQSDATAKIERATTASSAVARAQAIVAGRN